MPAIRDFTAQQLRWNRPHLFSHTYELCSGDQVLATISRSGLLNPHTIAETEGQRWIFRSSGLMRKKTEIYISEAQALDETAPLLASFSQKWNKTGDLIFNDGRLYTWTSMGFWRSTWLWIDAYNLQLLSLKKSKKVEIAPAASASPDLALLTLFGIHLMLVMAEEAAAASAG